MDPKHRAIFDAERLKPDLQYNFTHDISQDQDQDTQDQDQDTQDQDQDTQDQEQDTQDQDQDTQDQKQDTQDQEQDTQDQDQDTQDQDQDTQDQEQDTQDLNQDTQDQEQDTQDQDQDKKVQVAPGDDYQGLRRNRNNCHKDEQDEIWQTLTEDKASTVFYTHTIVSQPAESTSDNDEENTVLEYTGDQALENIDKEFTEDGDEDDHEDWEDDGMVWHVNENGERILLEGDWRERSPRGL
ncbi:uncharacterized protein DDB_G0290685 isoform X3 [Eurytemora carolleeae]|uniref:uncharacterized protein DDB_G0290685 isoform X3 n=1 Tax=Eurytemora carolleeae TaxID=1294199 RepID=UPI000C777053|nr:uncharacterized protein DDB_G0290685 isoform X3 [Eurytemora carolleeae]|eukprot:XP_023337156.1 uncharacterized protein DDB_G0290685-like isoform X3 [Eurytemora affinis]